MISKRWKLILAALPIIGTLAMAQPQPGGLGGFYQAWYGVASAEEWTPASLDSLVLWLDASDTEYINLQAGTNLVAQWNDKSPSGFDFEQDVTTLRPRWIDSYFIFDGVDDRLFPTTTNQIYALNAISFFIAYKPLTADGTSKVTFAANLNGSSQRLYNYYTSSSYQSRMGEASAITTNYNSSLNIHSATGDGTNHHYYLNGKLAGSIAENQSGGWDRMRIGAFPVNAGTASSLFAHIELYQIVILSGFPSDDERQQVEGYLAHKVGSQASLPSDHPYKNAPP